MCETDIRQDCAELFSGLDRKVTETNAKLHVIKTNDLKHIKEDTKNTKTLVMWGGGILIACLVALTVCLCTVIL